MKRAYQNDEHSFAKRQRSNGHDGHSDHRPRSLHSQSRHPKNSHPNHQTAPLPDSSKHLESLLKALLNHPDNTRHLLGHEAYESAVKLSESLSSISIATASLNLFKPSTIKGAELSSHNPNTSLSSTCQQFPLPTLPQVPDGPYSRAPFVHKSSSQHDRTSAVGDMTYERLEFLGDAYLEVIATRLIFSRYPHLAAGRQAQIR
ncbi:hypothetical protein KCU72_g24649, partial [Aureobasidium melanogenum]